MTRGVRRSDAYLSTFVKAEKLNLSAKPDPDPRVIQPRSPVYNVAVGIYLKPIEGVLYKSLGKIFGEPVVFKGMNADSQGALMAKKWHRFVEPVGVGLDAKRFDQHVSYDALRFEHSVYLAMFGNNPELRQLLSWQLENKGYVRAADGTIKYKVRGCRMSGDMNTGMGNCLLMCLLVHSYMESKGFSVDEYALANNGDDCVVITERRDLHRLNGGLHEWFMEMGFDMVMEDPVYILEHVEFCQMRPLWTSTGWRMVRHELVARSKDLVSLRPDLVSTEAGFDLLRKAISDGGISLCGDVPVMGEFYAWMGRGTTRRRTRRGKPMVVVDVTGFDMLCKGMSGTLRRPSPESRFSYWLAFGVTPEHQLALEERYKSLPPPAWQAPVHGLWASCLTC
jgi:hypothetical protein